MIYALVILAVILLLFAAFLFCVKPNKEDRRAQMKPFEERYIAHRGLYDNATDAPENSLKAFRLAVENGYGIELDVQRTADAKLVVFHDGNLKRICGVDKMLFECTFDELQELSLAESDEKIPLFSDVLKTIGGKVPLVVEIKSEGECLKTVAEAAEMLDHYNGIYCIESFHVGVVRWVRKNRPNVIRGQLSLDYFKWKAPNPWIEKLILSDMMLNFLSRPDFIAYDHRYAYRLSYRILRKVFRPENVAWTVQSGEELEKAEKIFQCIIFDSFIPDDDRKNKISAE